MTIAIREFIETLPHPLLRTHVVRYGGFSEYAPFAIRRREVAFSGVAVILALEGTWELTDPAHDGAWCARRSFVGGLVGAPVLVEHRGFTLTLQFDLTPLGTRQLLGVPGAELASRVVSVADVLGDAGRVLVERLRELESWPARFRALDGFLLDRLSAAAPFLRRSGGRGSGSSMLAATYERARGTTDKPTSPRALGPPIFIACGSGAQAPHAELS